VLSAEERIQWAGLSQNAKRRSDWLMGRLALKEAARRWIEANEGILLLPADVIVSIGPKGKPFIAKHGLEALGRLPEVSVAHAHGHAVAIAAPPGTPVGIDVETGDRVVPDDVVRGAFNESEREVIGNAEGAERRDRILRAWCAKEAAAKCLGEGLNGRPKTFSVNGFASDGGSDEARISGLGRELRVTFAARDDAILAVAFA
jgi:phosphopantetheinyl transferase